jgi:hypothetical protein
LGRTSLFSVHWRFSVQSFGASPRGPRTGDQLRKLNFQFFHLVPKGGYPATKETRSSHCNCALATLSLARCANSGPQFSILAYAVAIMRLWIKAETWIRCKKADWSKVRLAEGGPSN